MYHITSVQESNIWFFLSIYHIKEFYLLSEIFYIYHIKEFYLLSEIFH